MNTEIVKYERIQEYLRGKMSDEDRVAFERDLATDDTLRQQCEDLSLLARSIKKANQEVDLRMALEEAERQITEAPDALLNNSALETELEQAERELRMMGVPVEEPKESPFYIIIKKIRKAFKSIGQWFAMNGSWSVEISDRNPATVVLSRVSGVAVRLAVVGCFAFVCAFGTLSYNAHFVGMGYQITYDLSKGADPITEKILDGDYSEAQTELSDLIEYKRQQLQGLSPDSDQYQYISSEIDEMEFLDAVCDLRRWKYNSAKNKLKALANRDGAYQSEAKDLLDKLL